jgi:hypothetical protein
MELIRGRIPIGSRVADIAPEGSHKTTNGSDLSVKIASGTADNGHEVLQGPVLLVDQETPRHSLENWLDRFAQGHGFDSYRALPIYLYEDVFEFGRKVALDKLKREISIIQPVFVRFDSLTVMAPIGLRGKHENDSTLGNIIGRDLKEIIDAAGGRCTTMLAVHTRKPVAGFSLEQIEEAEAQQLARGTSSIVGEGADLGLIYKKISQPPDPTRFAVVTKVRRTAVSDYKTRLLELEEERYGQGWARLREISFDELPPSEFARDVFQLLVANFDGKDSVMRARKIHQELANFSRSEVRAGIQELIKRNVIISTKDGPQVYKLNPMRSDVVNPGYLSALNKK